MPSPRNATHRRTGWSKRQLAFLLTGIDWPFLRGDGWGDLHSLPPDQLREVLAEMLTCWREDRHLITPEYLGMNPSSNPAWFEKYASEAGIEQLFHNLKG